MFYIFKLLTLFLGMVWDWTVYKWWTRRHRHGKSESETDKQNEEQNIRDKVVIITGATSGLGKALVRQMTEKNAIVFMACRNLEKAQVVKKEIIEENPRAKLFVVELDLESIESVRKCAAQIKSQVDKVDVLINNAGCLGNPSVLERTEEGLEKVMATNYFGHFLLTKLLLNHLGRSENGRVICIGSTGCRFSRVNPTDLNFDVDSSIDFHGFRPYLNSKLCLMQFARHLPSRSQLSNHTGEKSITSYALCPGFIDSGLWADSSVFGRAMAKIAAVLFGLTPDQAAETVMYCAVSKRCLSESGRIYRFGSQLWTNLEQDSLFSSKTAEMIWNSTERLLEKYAT